MKLAIIVGTVRQNRVTARQARWVLRTAQAIEGVDAELVDLADYDMPFFAEPASPRYNPNRTDINPTARRWMDKLASFEAYIYVTPEYNHSIPAVLKNSFDYLDWQLVRKPAGIVSHGTVGGARAAMHLKEIISEAQAVPMSKFVVFPDAAKGIDEQSNLSAAVKADPYGPQSQLNGLLEDLKWYSDALAAARAQS